MTQSSELTVTGDKQQFLKQESWTSTSKFHCFHPFPMRKNLLIPTHSLPPQRQIFLDIMSVGAF